jgi:predicted N-acyltransferase
MRAPVPFRQPGVPVPITPVIRDDVPLGAIAPCAWDALTGGQPLLSHAFFSALHDSGCASPSTGWRPRFLTAWSGNDLVGAMPLYAKSHSYGEYVFDWGWADAYRRYDRRYYPKLVCAVPFTPVPGPRLLAASAATRAALLEHARALLAGGFSSLHVLFAEDAQAAEGAAAGLLVRRGVQFHWTNPGYRDFADFLSTFTHDKRKKVKQERRRLGEAGVRFVRKVGDEIGAADWAFFHACYERTYRMHHSTPYLTRGFFEQIGATLAPHLVLVVGQRDDGRPLCAALDVFDGEALWGRYWGTTAYVPGLHFEACYYQAIEFCIERRIGRFEGGAQGVHKLARGLLPSATHSLHAIADPAFASAIADYCARERLDAAQTFDELATDSPYRQDATAAPLAPR